MWSTQGKRGRYIIFQYEFEDEQHPISNVPHGNAKSNKPFGISKASTVQKIKVKTLTKGPSQVYDEVFEEAGGMMAFESLADIPKGRKQVQNFKYNSRPHKSKDELYDLVVKSKAESKPYIRRIQLPYLLVYKSNSCISRPLIFQVKIQIFHHLWLKK